MEKKLAVILSYVTHPLLMPLVGLLLISNSGTYAADLDPKFTGFIYMSVLLFTLVLPLAVLPILFYSGLSRSLQFTERSERMVPLYLTFFLYVAAYLLIRQLPVSLVYQRFLFSASLSVFFVLAISYFWKISAHLVGWGGIVGLVSVLSFRFQSDLMIFLILAIFCAGVAAFARLKLDEHNPIQVYSGFLLGLLTMLLVFSI
jgi:hypothetical protein